VETGWISLNIFGIFAHCIYPKNEQGLVMFKLMEFANSLNVALSASQGLKIDKFIDF
jgi:hypothetical protein